MNKKGKKVVLIALLPMNVGYNAVVIIHIASIWLDGYVR